MKTIESVDYKNQPFLLGRNIFEEAGVNVEANATLSRGTVLVRGDDGTFTAATAASLKAGVGIGVISQDLENDNPSKAIIYVRVMVSGSVNRELLLVEGSAISDAQSDILRGQTIIAEHVIDVD